MQYRRWLVSLPMLCLLAGTLSYAPVAAQGNGIDLIRAADLKDWLTYFSSDLFEGRRIYTEGMGMAAAYLADQMKSWGVRPAGDDGSYFQRVSVLGVKSTNRSTITIEANGQTRTFENGQGIFFPPNVGTARSFSSDKLEFMGYGLDLPDVKEMDYTGRNLKDRIVIYLGSAGPEGLDTRHRRLLMGRARYAADVKGALASIGPRLGGGMRPPGAPAPGGEQTGRPPQSTDRPDFTTVQRLDSDVPPAVGAQDDFFEFLFAGQQQGYSDLKALAEARKPLPVFSLHNVRITFNLDAEYRVVQTQYSRNVVGAVEGSDPKLKDTYVAYGAHYDHLGYGEGEIVQMPNGPQRAGARGRIKEGALEDRIWNGADDDGTGCIALLALARAFEQGPKPRRSQLFIFHTGEEAGLLGSRYFSDYPTVPLDSIVAVVNLDMIGRNSDDKPEETNTLYVVGDDRISTELHNLTVDANNSLSKPLKLDYELNDPSDPEQVYYRSDHYSYAAKGIPVVFLTSGLHPDYHYNTDSAEKINYDKFERSTRLCYEIGMKLSQLDHAPLRDNLGPRAGKVTTGKLER